MNNYIMYKRDDSSVILQKEKKSKVVSVSFKDNKGTIEKELFEKGE